MRFSHSYARAGGDPCRALGVPAISRPGAVIDVSLDTKRLVRAKWFRRYYAPPLDRPLTARWQRWRVTLGSEQVTIQQDIECRGAGAAVSPTADPFARLVPADAAAYAFACQTHPDPRVKRRVRRWLVEAMGPNWADAQLRDVAYWTVPTGARSPVGPAMVSVVAARFRDRARARARLAKSCRAWAEAVGGTHVRRDDATQWCIPYRQRPRLIHRWYGDVLVVGAGATGLGPIVAGTPTQSLTGVLARGPVVGQERVRTDRLGACLRAEAAVIPHVGGWGSWSADRWADGQLTDLLDWFPMVPAIGRVTTAEHGRLRIVTTITVTRTPASSTASAERQPAGWTD